MEQSEEDPTPRKLVVNDLETEITPAMAENFLETIKVIDSVSFFCKDEDKLYLQFTNEDDGLQFIQKHNYRSQIMARKFNIYWACFQKRLKGSRIEVNGVTQSKLRNIYDQCKKYGPCRLNLNYQGQMLDYKCMIEFLNPLTKENFQQLQVSLAGFEIKIRSEQEFVDVDKFRCSISLSHFQKKVDYYLSAQEEDTAIATVKSIVREVTDEPISGIELHTFYRKKQPAIKAYFKFKDNNTTFSQFQKLRRLLLDKPDMMRCRMFYFQHEANTFRTIFIQHIFNKKRLSHKHLEDKLITSFRKIHPNVVQVLLKRTYGNVFSGKFYLREQINGRELIIDYLDKMKYIHQFFVPFRPLDIDMFRIQKQEEYDEDYIKVLLENQRIRKQKIRQQKLKQGLLASKVVQPPAPSKQSAPPSFSHLLPLMQQQYHQPRPDNHEKPSIVHEYDPKEDKGIKSQEDQEPKVKLFEDGFPEMK